jgi:hypothetical protein
MDLRKNIRHFLNEEIDNRKIFLNQMNKFGLLNLLKMSGVSYGKLFSLGIGPEHLTRKIKQEFIQDVIQSLGGINLIEYDIEPIFYNQNDTDYEEITYLGVNKVAVTVWYTVTNDISAEFGVLYHNLNDNIIDEIFDIVVELYDNDDIITESTNKEDEDTEKFDKLEYFIKKATKLINKMKFDAIKRVEFEYNKEIEGFNVNIIYDRQFAIDNPKNFNKVKQNSIKEIGTTITSYFPFKFLFYLHSE